MAQTSSDGMALAALAAGSAASADEIIAALHRFALHIADAPDLDVLLRSALLAAAQITGARHATALLLDQQAEHIRYRVALDSGNLAPLELIAKPMMRNGLAGWVARERVSALIIDTEQDSRWLPGPGLGDLRAVIVAPLLLGQRLLGLITLGHETPGHFSNQHLRLLEVLCATVALAVERADVGAASASGSLPLQHPSAPLRAAAQSEPQASVLDPWSAPAGAKSARAPSNAPTRPCARTIVALSAELRGLFSITPELSPTVLFEDVLDAYFARMDVIIRQHDGDIDSMAGGMLLAIFSSPEQAAGAAIQMCAAAAQLEAHWRETLEINIGGLDIGIARGEAVIGTLSMRHGTSRAFGPVVGVAARLRELARGEILVASDVAEKLREQTFSLQALRPLRLRNGVMQQIFCVSARG